MTSTSPAAATVRLRDAAGVLARAGESGVHAMVTIGGLDSPVGPGLAIGAVAIVDGFGVGRHDRPWDGGE